MTAEQVEVDPLARALRRVQALLAQADHPNTDPIEAQTFRAKADEMMARYKIDRLEAEAAGTVEVTKVIWEDIPLCTLASEFRQHYGTIGAIILRHCDLRGGAGYANVDGVGTYRLTCVGFEGDMRYAQLLLASAIGAFGARLEPEYDHNESEAANALRMRQGGMERARIARVLFGTADTLNGQKTLNRKVTNLIKSEAKKQDVDVNGLLGRTSNIKTYRVSYADGFVQQLSSRLQDIRFQRRTEGSIVLKNAKERVDEAFYERYPNLRPSTEPRAEIGEDAYTTHEKCSKCAKAASGYCREHGWLKPKKPTYGPYSGAGARAGRNAASTVDLGGVRRPVN